MAIYEYSPSLGETWRVERDKQVYPRNSVSIIHSQSVVSFEGLRCFEISRCGSYRMILLDLDANIDHRPLRILDKACLGPGRDQVCKSA